MASSYLVVLREGNNNKNDLIAFFWVSMVNAIDGLQRVGVMMQDLLILFEFGVVVFVFPLG